MTFGLYTNIVSPHQLPLAREIVKRVGAENYRYIYTEPFHAERAGMGWNIESEPWIIPLNPQPTTLNPQQAQEWLENCDVLLCCPRDLDLIERRCQLGLRTYYTNERWFKPIPIKFKFPLLTYFLDLLSLPSSRLQILLPGCLRLLHPRYFRMVRRFVKLVKKYDSFRLLPIGIHAYNDFLRMGIPKEKMTVWGYFVAPSETKKVGGEIWWSAEGAAPSVDAFVSNASDSFPANSNNQTIKQSNNPLRVLYVGRLIPLKRVDTIIRAVALANEMSQSSVDLLSRPTFSLSILGDGPEKSRLQTLTQRLSASIKNQSSTVNLNLQPQPFIFLPSVPISSVRALMRQHDVLVFASNAEEGWGAVVSEALEEGLIVLGSNQSGAAATILPETQRFDCGDYKRLAELLCEVRSSKFRVQSSELKVESSKFRVQSSEFKVQSSKFRVQSSELKVQSTLNIQHETLNWVDSIGEWSAAKAAERIVSCAL